jgi:hypothetical protein
MIKATKWCVLFETKDGCIHPIYLQSPKRGVKIGRDTVDQYAGEYLQEQRDWLVRVVEVYSKDNAVGGRTDEGGSAQ